MKKYTALIIEDEAPARDLIRHYLQSHPGIKLAGECSDGFEGAKQIASLKPDLIFLDIQMPRISGFEMLELLDEATMPQVIFTTAFDQFAIRAFEFNALDYLLKPIARDRFDQAVSRALTQLDAGSRQRPAIQKVLEKPAAGGDFIDRIVLRSGAGIHVIPQEDIICLEAQDDYVLIYTAQKEEYIKKKTLKYYEENLDPGRFLRVHRSCIVAIDAIQKIEPYSKDAWIACLKNGQKMPVSKAGYASLRKTFDF
jgi:two-component system, LytTR family, response regulator